MDCKGKKILVTGAGQGIGRELVKELHKQGVTVFALSRTASHLDSLRAECKNIQTIQVDVGDWKKTRSAVSAICPVDVLINNAAISDLQPFTEITEDTWDSVFNINVKAVINISQVVASSMIENKIEGNIINVSSVASRVALENHTAYCSSKAALDSITRNMALELGKHKIRVNSVQPTVVMTQMGQMAWGDPKKAEPVLNKIPLKRFANPEDVVNMILFLISSKSSMVNGTHIPIDGGFLV